MTITTRDGDRISCCLHSPDLSSISHWSHLERSTRDQREIVWHHDDCIETKMNKTSIDACKRSGHIVPMRMNHRTCHGVTECQSNRCPDDGIHSVGIITVITTPHCAMSSYASIVHRSRTSGRCIDAMPLQCARHECRVTVTMGRTLIDCRHTSDMALLTPDTECRARGQHT